MSQSKEATFLDGYRQHIVASNNAKIGHSASRSLVRSSEDEKNEVLTLYKKIRKRAQERESETEDLPIFEQEAVSTKTIFKMLSSDDDLKISVALRQLLEAVKEKNPSCSICFKPVYHLVKSHSDEKIRSKAVRILPKINSDMAFDILISVIQQDSSEKVKENAIKAIGGMATGHAFDFINSLSTDIWNQSIRVRKSAIYSLGQLNPSRAVDILSDLLLNDLDADIRKEAGEVLALSLLKIEKNKAVDIVKTVSSQVDFQAEEEHEVRIAIINSMMVVEDASYVELLKYVLKSDPHMSVRGKAAHALAHFFDPDIERVLLDSLRNEETGLKKRIALALAQYAMKNPLKNHDAVCEALIEIQKTYPRESYIWKKAVQALPAC